MDNSTVIQQNVIPASNINLAGLQRIPAVRQLILLIGVAAAVAAGFAIVLWSQTPSYTQLYGGLDAAEASEVAEALRNANIEFKISDSNGSVMVPVASLHTARLRLASQGLPQSVSAGMDNMQDQSSFGVSQFMESARYQHALEAELARTISSIGAVNDARIHLALPKQTSFIRSDRQASASVFLQLGRGRSLEPDQASAIVNLVASSVPNLSTKNVTVIDEQGRLLSSGDQKAGDILAASQFRYSQRLEETLKRKIEDLLTPIVGAGRVRAQVSADVDFTITEETRESFDPAKTVVRSEQINEQQRSGGTSAASGVPGAVSNQPPESSGAANPQAAADTGAEATPPSNTTRSSVRNFEVDRTISHVRPNAGNISKLSVAVLVDDSVTDANAGSAASSDAEAQSSITPEDVARFTALVKEAVGFDEARGDTVVFMNTAFKSVAPVEEAEAPAIWEKPIVRDSLKQILGAVLVLAIAFGVVRPMLRSVVSSGAGVSADFVTGMPNYVVTPGGAPQISSSGAPVPLPNYDEKVAAAKNITGHDPARVAQVVKKWVSVDG